MEHRLKYLLQIHRALFKRTLMSHFVKVVTFIRQIYWMCSNEEIQVARWAIFYLYLTGTGASKNYQPSFENFPSFLFWNFSDVSPQSVDLNIFPLYSDSSWLIVYSPQNSTLNLFLSLNTIIFLVKCSLSLVLTVFRRLYEQCHFRTDPLFC